METTETPSPATIMVGVAVIAGGLFLIWYASRPAPAADALEKVAETIVDIAAKAGTAPEKVLDAMVQAVAP
jgi:hypothetical protein